MAEERDQASFASLLSGAINDVRELFRQEVSLARAEIRQEVTNAKSAAVKLGAAAVTGLFATLLLLIALARGLSDLFAMPVWAGFTIVGGVLAIAAGVLVAVAWPNIKSVSPMPERTVRTMKENLEWVKRQTS
ncbi:MAG TPA: phage holin family protein [Vicinamibacterales bacterium]|nr:phage holin family protein [Acidobacteriota bacterium]HOC19169.1 phage holin family protein [Vicinamibacterales bacterium]